MVVRYLLRAVPVALVGVAVLASLPQAPAEYRFAPCNTSCQQQRWDADVAAAEHSMAAQVAQLTAGKQCWTGARSRIPATVVVHDDGGTVERVVSFTQGMVLARAGKVWVDAACA